MPKGFTEQEKQKIKEDLLNKGMQLFGTYGLKKTGIADITQAVGIAQGSFYSFYESKEELYFELINREQAVIKEEIFKRTAPYENQPKEYLRQLFTCSFELIEKSTIIKQVYEENIMDSLVRKLPDRVLKEHAQQDDADLLPLITAWQSKGIKLRGSIDTISGLMRSIFMLTLHKKEIGENVYEATMKLLIELISEGLIVEEVPHE